MPSKPQRNGKWKKSGSPYSLYNAKDDQYGQAPCQAAEGRTGGKDSQRQNIEAFGSQAIGEEGGCRCDDALREDIGSEYPLDAVKVSAEGVLQAWNSDVDDGLIQDTHKCTEDHHQGDNPLVL